MYQNIDMYINLAGAIIKQAEEDYVMYLSKVMGGRRIIEEQIVRASKDKKYETGRALQKRAAVQVKFARKKAEAIEEYFRNDLTRFWDFDISWMSLVKKATERAETKVLRGVRCMVKDIVNEEIGIMTDERIREIVEDVIEETIEKIAGTILQERRKEIKERLSRGE